MLVPVLVPVLLVGILCASVEGILTPVRICVVSRLEKLCKQMENDHPHLWRCITGRDDLDCARKLNNNSADVANFAVHSIYASGKYFNGLPIATEHIDGAPHKYQGVALVRKDSDINGPEDLRGRSSCHTGYGRTVGWSLPVALLTSRYIMEPDCEHGPLGAVENFFRGGSCVPSNWSDDPIVDAELKKRHRNLCSRCDNPDTCSGSDRYSGYEGVMRCLRESSGDVAFTKVSTLRSLLRQDPALSGEVDLLCLEGGRQPLTADLANPCTWGFRPSNAYVTTPSTYNTIGDRMLGAIRETQTLYSNSQKPEWYYKVFASDPKVSSIEPVTENRRNYRNYLGDFIYTIEKPRTGCTEAEYPAIYCTTSEEEKAKCEDFAKASASRGFTPPVQCTTSISKVACMTQVKDGYANLVTLDGGDVYTGGRYYYMVPISAELYGNSDAAYYSVAVLRSASDVTTLRGLKGLRSCHTGMGRTAGWVVPVGALLSDGDLDEDECNRAVSVAAYFSEGSCVPGANDTKYNPGRRGADKLCQNCVGDVNGDNKCARDSKERYNGYAGAFRCLAEGRGDVAFVKHTTVPQYTDGRDQADWSKDLLSSDFQLLCGENKGTSPINDYLACNLAKVPSHYVMSSQSSDESTRLKFARLLAAATRFFGDDSDFFKLFEPHNGNVDMLFKDSTTALKAAPLDSTYEKVLGEAFYNANEAVDPRVCDSSGSS